MINNKICIKAGYFQTLYKNLIKQNQITFTGKYIFCVPATENNNSILTNLPPDIGFGDLLQLVFTYNCSDDAKFKILFTYFNAQYDEPKNLKTDNLKKMIHDDIRMKKYIAMTNNDVISVIGLSFYNYYLENMINREIFKLDQTIFYNLRLLMGVITNFCCLYNTAPSHLQIRLIEGEFADIIIHFPLFAHLADKYESVSRSYNNYVRDKINPDVFIIDQDL